jgi:hypothetical protein
MAQSVDDATAELGTNFVAAMTASQLLWPVGVFIR